MLGYLVRRLMLFLPTLLGATVVIFALMAAAPSSVIDMLLPPGGNLLPGQRAVREQYLEERYGLNKPVPLQYLRWLNNISPVGFERWQRTDPEVMAAKAQETARRADRVRQLVAAGVPQPSAEDRARKEIDLEPDAGAPRTDRPTVKWPDLGHSFAQSRPAWDRIKDALPVTMSLQVVSLPLALFVAVFTGVQAARFRGRFQDRLVGGVLLALYSVPVIWVGTLLVGFLASEEYGGWIRGWVRTSWLPTFSLAAAAHLFLVMSVLRLMNEQRFRWPLRVAFYASVLVWLACFLSARGDGRLFPSSGLHSTFPLPTSMAFLPSFGADGAFRRGYLLDTLWHVVLPIVCLSYGTVAYYSKLTRTALLETLSADFVRTARAKGLSERVVLWRHAFRNSLIPLITVAAEFLPALVVGSVVVEYIFGIDGMGRLAIDALKAKDTELFLSISVIVLVLRLLGNLLADLMYAVADPRVTYNDGA